MRNLCKIIKKQVSANFINLETAIKTYNRNALVCGSPAWRYIYHTIHSADKWFFNPERYTEPEFHKVGMDNPDNPCDIELSDETLLEYLSKVQNKTYDYLDKIKDKDLYEKPDGCEYTRLELILAQFRHISIHTGMINGLTIEKTGKFPVFCGLDKTGFKKLEKSLYDD